MINNEKSQRSDFIFKFFALIFLSLTAAGGAFSQSSDTKILALRHQFAVRYLQPEAHFALAQYYLDKNDKLQAFLIVEYARRYRFAEKDFNSAFVKFFGDNSPEPSVEAKRSFEKGYDLLKQNKTDEAEKSLVEAAKLAPKSGFIQGWVGRFFFKVKADNAQALKYYYNAYFLDPDAYETEFVESRIRNIEIPLADAKFTELVINGKSLAEISTNANALIVGNAVEQMGKQWKKEYTKPLLECLSNDDSLVRWFAFTTIFKNAGVSADQFIIELQNDRDLRKRGLAAYALIESQKKKSFPALQKMLLDKAELVRFDALSALALAGKDDGLEILKTHLKVETSQYLKDLINKTLEKK